MESPCNNFHSFIFCQRGLLFTGKAYHFDLSARPRGQSGLHAHRELVERLEGGRAGGARRAGAWTFPGRAVSVSQARRMMQSIPPEEQAQHIWFTGTGPNPVGAALDRINDALESFTGPGLPGSVCASTSQANSASSISLVRSRATPTSIANSATSTSLAHSASSTYLATSASSTSLATSASSTSLATSASSTSLAHTVSSTSVINLVSPSASSTNLASPAASYTNLARHEAPSTNLVNVVASTSLSSRCRGGNTCDGEDSDSARSDVTTDVYQGSDSESEDDVNDANGNAFMYSSTSLLSIASSRIGGSRSRDDVITSSSRHSLIYSWSETSLPILDDVITSNSRNSLIYSWSDASLPSLDYYGPSDVPVPYRPEIDILQPVQQDSDEIIRNWLATVEKITPVCVNNDNDDQDVRKGLKRKAPFCSESSARMSKKPIAVVRPIMAAKRRRV